MASVACLRMVRIRVFEALPDTCLVNVWNDQASVLVVIDHF